MEKLEDSDLIQKVIEDSCNDSFNELLNRHEKLFYKICQKYGPVVRSSGSDLEDLLGDKSFVFYKAISSYNPAKKTKFSTWLGNFTRYHCLNYINSNCKYVNFESKDFDRLVEVFHQKEGNDENERTELAYFVERVFDILLKLKDKRIHEVYKKRYKSIDKQTWSSIANQMDISTQTVINLHSKGKDILHRKMSSKKFLDVI